MSEAEELTIQEVADRLGVHYMTAYRYVRTGALPARQVGARWMVPAADVEALRDPGSPASPRPGWAGPSGSPGPGWPGRPGGSGRSGGPGRSGGLVRARPQLHGRLVAGDEAGAWSLVHTALSSGATPEAVYMDLLVPVMKMVGDDWEAGRLQVSGEHRATAAATRIVGRLGPLFARRGRPRGTVVVGVVASDRHALPAAVLADLLRGDGFQVLDLGADSPVESFVESALLASRLVAVMIGVTLSGLESGVAATVQALRSAGVAAPVLAGGAGLAGESAALELGVSGWSGRDARTALRALNQVAPPRRPASRPVP